MKIMDEKKYNHIELNNEVTKRKDNGFFNLEKDQEALNVYLEEISDKTIYFDSEIERLHYLVDNHFYFNVFKKYSEEDLIEIIEFAKSINFEFASYMSASKFYKDYALKTNDKSKYLEDYNQHVAIVALYLADGNKEQAKEYLEEVISLEADGDISKIRLSELLLKEDDFEEELEFDQDFMSPQRREKIQRIRNRNRNLENSAFLPRIPNSLHLYGTVIFVTLISHNFHLVWLFFS